jgi:hypothetical protein
LHNDTVMPTCIQGLLRGGPRHDATLAGPLNLTWGLRVPGVPCTEMPPEFNLQTAVDRLFSAGTFDEHWHS